MVRIAALPPQADFALACANKGRLCPIEHDNSSVFAGLPQLFKAVRYNSLIVERRSLPNCLRITATSQVRFITR